ncbi:MAG: hypothetical protein PHQ35_02575 [Phycisphaerae bacterium]|nr:hypothetical protein [Phycisphaerae bacterium]MDD5380531.1 hypothetical protein [Phycisphaerae bacterium]
MAKGQLRRKQLAVLDDLFNSDLDEQRVLEKHGVGREVYERWLANEVFAERFGRYADNMRRRSELLMAKYRCLAAAKLVELTASEKAETARKACLDIISQENDGRKKMEDGRECSVEKQQPNTVLSLETASRILAVLAEGKSAGGL